MSPQTDTSWDRNASFLAITPTLIFSGAGPDSLASWRCGGGQKLLP